MSAVNVSLPIHNALITSRKLFSKNGWAELYRGKLYNIENKTFRCRDEFEFEFCFSIVCSSGFSKILFNICRRHYPIEHVLFFLIVNVFKQRIALNDLCHKIRWSITVCFWHIKQVESVIDKTLMHWDNVGSLLREPDVISFCRMIHLCRKLFHFCFLYFLRSYDGNLLKASLEKVSL